MQGQHLPYRHTRLSGLAAEGNIGLHDGVRVSAREASDAGPGTVTIRSYWGSFGMYDGGFLHAQGNVYVLAKTFIEFWDGVDVWSEIGSIAFGESITDAGVLMASDERISIYGNGYSSSLSALKGLRAIAIGDVELRDGVQINVGKRGPRTSAEGVLLKSERGNILVDNGWIASESPSLGNILLSALQGDIRIVGADIASEGGKVGVEAGAFLGVGNDSYCRFR